MKKILIGLSLIVIGVLLGVFIFAGHKDDFNGYYSKTDKEISQNIEKSIELTALNQYSKVVYNFKNVKNVYLIGPYNWPKDEFIKPFNNRSIISHWEYLLAEEDKYLFIIVTNEHFLPIILWRAYGKEDFKKLGKSLLTNKLCNQIQCGINCHENNSVDIIISNINDKKSDITVKINSKGRK